MGQVLHGSATTTEAIRRTIQNSQESLRTLAKRYGINQKTVAKWKKRTSVADLPTGPQEPRSTILSLEEEAIVVAFRKHTLLPLDDCLYALQPTIPHLTRSSLHRCLQRHGISRLPEVEGDKPGKKKFKRYPIGYASLDAWFAELVRRIMFIGLFAFILDRGPSLAKAIVDSLFQIGAGGGSASPANIFDAGIRVASKMSEQAKFGLWEDNALAIAAVFAMVVVASSLVAAIFVAVMVEMYIGLLAGMIMLGLGGSSYTKDFAVRYLVYAFSVGMKSWRWS